MSEVAEAQTTLRDQLEASFETHEAQEQVDIQSDRPRDESGRFAPKAEAPAQTQEIAAPEAPQIKPRPTSWKKDYEEHWTKLDPTLQDYINQRESEYAKGVSTYKQNWEQAAPIYEAMQPFMPVLQQHGMQPSQWIQGLGNAHLTLVQGTPEQKLQMFSKLAMDYGVPIQALTGQQADPQFGMLVQELNQLKTQWNQFHSTREQQEQAQIQTEIASFSKDKPHFDAVRETMAQLLQSGVASDLQSAYDKAIRLNDELWQQKQEEAQQAAARQATEARQATVAKAKATAVSPRSISPTANMGSGNGKKSLREQLAEQIDSQLGGRV
jgi:hypothetical protein